MNDRLQEFVCLFNSGRFFEAHEVLESLWLETQPPLKDFYKGLVQCAVAFAHVQRGNRKGALAVWERSKNYLQNYPAVHQTILTHGLIRECEEFFMRWELSSNFQPPKITTTS